MFCDIGKIASLIIIISMTSVLAELPKSKLNPGLTTKARLTSENGKIRD